MTLSESAQSANPFESATELKENHARLLAQLDARLTDDASVSAEAIALHAMAPGIEEFLRRGAATGVWLEDTRDRTACQVLLDYWASGLSRAGAGAGASSPRLARFDGNRLPDLRDKPCPYVGLEAFRDHTFFFGREADTRALLDQVLAAPLTIVLGASGSGKSSLVMGGLLPALARPGVRRWRIAPVCVPGEASLENLSVAIAAIAPVPEAGSVSEIARLREDPARLAVLLDAPRAPPAVIVIDQFEEVFTLSGQTERDAFAALLGGLLDANTGHRVVLTMREEFRSRLVELRALERYLDRAWYSMRPMGYEELCAAVEKPAELVNLHFHPGIVDDLVKKVLGQPAALPLLQFTLRQLWDKRDRNRITWEVYREVRDPLEALKASADAFYDGLAPQTRDEVKRILLELVRVDDLLEAYRQPVRRSRLLEAGRANTGEVLVLLADNDYVRITSGAPGGDAVVEVKHEALIRNWPMFVGWIDEKRVERRQRLALTQAARRWQESGRPPEGLLTGWQLQDARRHATLSELERAFVDASAEAVERAQREKEEALRRELEQTRASEAQAKAREAEATALAEREGRLRRRQRFWLIVAVCAAVVYGVVAANLIPEVARLEKIRAELASSNAALEKARAKLEAGVAKLDTDNRLLHQEKAQLEQRFAELQAEYDRLFALQVGRAVAPASHLPSSQPVTIYVQISDESQRARAEEIVRQLKANGIRVPGIERIKEAPATSEVRYFRPADKLGADEIVRLLHKYLGVDSVEPRLVRGYDQKVPGRQYEIWFSRTSLARK